MSFDDDDLVQRSSVQSMQNFDDLDNNNEKGNNRDNQSHSSEVQLSIKQQFKNLKKAVAELYLSIKQKTRDDNETVNAEEEKEERDIILSLDPYVVIDYIKSSVDIILNLKFEEIEKRLIDKNNGNPNRKESTRNKDLKSDTIRTNNDGQISGRSSVSQIEGPPQIYEEVIQNLEADIRKHIRIEQQLKLHIESIENRVEELENQNEKLEKDNDKMKVSSKRASEVDKKLLSLEKLIKDKDDLIKKNETQFQVLKERQSQLQKELEITTQKLQEQTSKSAIDLSFINQAIDNAARTQELQDFLSQTQPMILKQSSIQGDRKINISGQQNKKQIIQQNNLGSYSSNQSFIDNAISPDRKTPDLSHPYMQTQIISKKKNNISSTSKNKKSVPQTLVDNFGLQASLNALASTYSVASQQKLGSRKLSQQSRQKSLKGVQKNQWIGQYNNGQGFSNIINNNIQGLSINYSNQIIHNTDLPLQKYNSNFISTQNQIKNNTSTLNDDSDSSNLNSHRRCKSQNVKREANESTDRQSIGKKSVEKRKNQDKRQVLQDISADEFQHTNNNKITQNTDKKNQRLNDIAQENQLLAQQQSFIKDANYIISDFDSQNKRRIVKQNQISASTGSANNFQGVHQLRSVSSRFQQQADELTKMRFNQSNFNIPNVLQSRTSNFSGQPHLTASSHSVEKRSRNKQQFNQNQTAVISSKFDPSTIIDMHYKTTLSTSTQQSKGNKSAFVNSNKNNNSAHNTAQFISQQNVALIKQQLLATKKASNVIIKGLSPLKKQ